MSQRQYRRINKKESQTHNNPRRSGGRDCPNSAAQPHYQQIYSPRGRGRGRGSAGESIGISHSLVHFHSSTNNSYKKPTGEGGKSRIVAANSSESDIVQTTSSTTSGISETFDASAPKATSEPTVPYRQGHGETIPQAASSRPHSETTSSATLTSPLRGEPLYGVSLQPGSLNSGFVNEIQVPYNFIKQETTESSSSNLEKQKSKEDMEQIDSENSHLHYKASRHVRSPHNSSNQKKYKSFKPASTLSMLSLYGKQHTEDMEQSKNEIPYLQHEAKRKMHDQVASVGPAINSTQDISLSIPGILVATSPFQQPCFQLQFGMSRLQTWSQGTASASVQMPVQSPIGDSSQFQQFAYFSSFQPHALQSQVMHYGYGLTIPTTFDTQFDSQLINFYDNPQLHVQNVVKNANPRTPVKITHPETKEELKLDELVKPKADSGSFDTGAHQAQPLSYGHSHLTNYFSHIHQNSFFLHSPSTVTFSSTQMFPTKPRLKYLGDGTDIHGAVTGSNSDHGPSASIPTNSKLDFHFVGEKILPPVSVNSVVNNKSEVIKSTRPHRVSYKQGKSNIHPKISVKTPPKVITKPTNSVVSSHRAITPVVSIDDASVMGGLIKEPVSGDGKNCVVTGDSEYLSKSEGIKMFDQYTVDNICKDQNMNQLELPETSGQRVICQLNDRQKVGDISTSKLQISENVEGTQNKSNITAEIIILPKKKRYSRDFLLTISNQFVELPTDFELLDDMAKEILVSKVLDDQGYRVGNGSKWIKTRTFASEQEHQFGISWRNFGVHSSQDGIYGKNLYGQIPDHYDSVFATASLPRSTSQYGRRNKGPDVDRWQRSTLLNKCLPKSPLQVMHKAVKKYELHKMIDGEEAKQRRLKAILNKLTPQNFERLFQQVKEVNIDNIITLSGLISQIFDKALMEPTFCEMYANFCFHLASELPNFFEGHEKITFKRLLLNKCQEEFVRGEREQAETDKIEENGKARLSEEKREEKRIRSRRRMLGNIRLIGELYKKRMLTEGVMHDCIQKLLGNHDYPDEEDVEALCKLLSTVGEIIDHPKAKEKIDAYFKVMKNLSNKTKLSSRMQFMLKDVIDLRKNKWQQRRKVEGPKKIEELHIDAAQERRALVSQLICSSNIISSDKKVSANFNPKASSLQSSQNFRVGTFPAMSPQVHRFASQDVCLEHKHPYNQGSLSVPFTQRLSDGMKLSPGRKVDHAKKISIRGPPMLYGSLLADLHTDFDESGNILTSPGGYSSTPYQKQYYLKQHDLISTNRNRNKQCKKRLN